MNRFFPLRPGLIAVTGGERTGKTSLLRRLCGDMPAIADETPHPDAMWLDLALPLQDGLTAMNVWQTLQHRSPMPHSMLHFPGSR